MEDIVKKFMAVLLCLSATALMSAQAAAARPVVGVAEFKNETHAGWWGRGVGWELSGMLANELASSGRFRVVERSKLETVLREQDLAASGRMAKGTGAKIGKLTGAKYLVLGTVTSYQENTASTGGGFSFKGISIGGKKTEAYIAVDVRVVDTTSGVLEHVRTVEARSGGHGINLGLYRGGFGGRLADQKKTPAGKAIRAVLVEITDYLQCVMVERGSCLDEFDAKERRRRDSLRDSISLD
jgi:curli biogenesis system outer membrane secretion channel CsgG